MIVSLRECCLVVHVNAPQDNKMDKIADAYNRFCEKRFPLPSEFQVANLERKMGVPLPTDYRQFILTFNGGYFSEPDIVPPSDKCPLDGLTFLSGIGASHHSAELDWPPVLGSLRDNDPPQILPIGYTLMGNLLFVVAHPKGLGRIGLKVKFSDDSYFLADGIASFFGLLREPEDE